MNIVNVRSIDNSIYQSIKTHNAFVYAIHPNTLHILSYEKEIITIGHHISKGKHHILIDEAVSFNKIGAYLEQKITIKEGSMHIGNMVFWIVKDSVEVFKPYDKTYSYNDIAKQNVKKTSIYIAAQYKELFEQINNDKIHSYIYDKVKRFLEKSNYHNAKEILGLGPGLTPFGDDVLVGYLLGINAINVKNEWTINILKDAKQSTNHFSYQNLLDTFDKLYPEIYIKLVEEFFSENSIKHVEDVLDIGQTSGLGIICGFIYGIKEG